MKANKLLRVLVVGGIALAGSAGAARADDKPAGEAQKEAKAPKGDAKAKDAKAAKEKEAKEKKEKDEKKAEEAGGVKGW